MKKKLMLKIATLEAVNKKRFWQIFKHLHGGTEGAMSELKKTKDYNIYHGTGQNEFKKIKKSGFLKLTNNQGYDDKGVYLGTKPLSNLYAEHKSAFGEKGVLLKLKHHNELGKEKLPNAQNFINTGNTRLKTIKTIAHQSPKDYQWIKLIPKKTDPNYNKFKTMGVLGKAKKQNVSNILFKGVNKGIWAKDKITNFAETHSTKSLKANLFNTTDTISPSLLQQHKAIQSIK